MPVDNVAASAPATSAWANSVADAVNELEGDLYPTIYGQLEVPWADVTGKPSTFTPEDHAASHATGAGDELTPGAIGAATSGHTHTLSALGAAAAYDTPATADGGKRVYVGSATPTGASEGDIWIKG